MRRRRSSHLERRFGSMGRAAFSEETGTRHERHRDRRGSSLIRPIIGAADEREQTGSGNRAGWLRSDPRRSQPRKREGKCAFPAGYVFRVNGGTAWAVGTSDVSSGTEGIGKRKFPFATCLETDMRLPGQFRALRFKRGTSSSNRHLSVINFSVRLSAHRKRRQKN